jgi:hypothetical protein
MAQQEDVAAGIVAIITLVLSLIPQIQSSVPPQYMVAILAIALVLKTALGYLQKPITYGVTGLNPQGQPFSSRITITPPDTLAAETSNLQQLGFTNLIFTPTV